MWTIVSPCKPVKLALLLDVISKWIAHCQGRDATKHATAPAARQRSCEAAELPPAPPVASLVVTK
jgi:hypothetical protein